MAPAGQGAVWSEVLCCTVCSHLFTNKKLPVNLSCGHTLCRGCLLSLSSSPSSPACPIDQVLITTAVEKLPVNRALMSILNIETPLSNLQRQLNLDEQYFNIEKILIKLSSYLKRTESERGGSVWSEELSRPIQRKLLALLCLQIAETEGRQRSLKTAKGLVERILTELLIAYQNHSHLSASLWSAVRARGCQFLGPAMQEEVLRLILLTLSDGDLIARKTLVLYIVQTLSSDYPQVSKTCVGHVVQLLYRASCFNVIKREGESSLMQLKSEFCDYETLRREHDSQIVQIAMEAGLRVSPDQWSALLYGDQLHRSHMQSIIDKLQSPEAFEQMIKDLQTVLQHEKCHDLLLQIIPEFYRFSVCNTNVLYSWKEVAELFESLAFIIHAYVQFTKRRNEHRNSLLFKKGVSSNNCYDFSNNERKYKTRLCRDIESGRICPRGSRCTYAHSKLELASVRRKHLLSRSNFGVSDLLPNAYSFQSISTQIVSHPTTSKVIHQQTYETPCNLGTMLPTTAASNSVNVVVSPIAQPLSSQTVMLDPHQPIGIVSLPVPIVPVVVQQNPTVESVNSTIPVMPVVVQGNTATPAIQQLAAVPTFDACGSPSTVPLGPVSFNSSPAIHGPTNLPPQSQQQSVMLSTVGQILDDLSGRSLEVPLECAESYWSLFDDGRCALTVTPASTTADAHLISFYDRRPSAQYYRQCKISFRRLTNLNNDGSGNLSSEETADDDDLQSHVSYTVANSVLYEEKEVSVVSTSGGSLQLPVISLRYNTVPSTDETVNRHSEPAVVSAVVLSVCSPCVYTTGTKPATVQAPCAVMQIRDTIKQPLSTPVIQKSISAKAVRNNLLDPAVFVDQLSPIIRSYTNASTFDPQNVVSSTLDRIVDVKERLNDVQTNGAIGCSTEKQQLKSLDKRTKQTCLLRELEAVEKKMEILNTNQ
uniref:RING-type E3 ubiquitin transferase n=1 Tax=Syphacia muris TaxID=451379 RepID=A0A0N5AMT4_9BILA